MSVEIKIMKWNGELEREVWDFRLSIGMIARDCCIRLDAYSFQTRESTRHRKWKKLRYWDWLMQRESNMEKPSIPPNVTVEVRQRIQQVVSALPIQ